jgi:hypothetical protein
MEPESVRPEHFDLGEQALQYPLLSGGLRIVVEGREVCEVLGHFEGADRGADGRPPHCLIVVEPIHLGLPPGHISVEGEPFAGLAALPSDADKSQLIRTNMNPSSRHGFLHLGQEGAVGG